MSGIHSATGSRDYHTASLSLGVGGISVNEFPERLRKLREEKRTKRHIPSQRCGLPSDATRRYERGEAEPDLLSLIAIADFFEVSLDYLTGRADYR